MNDHKPAIFAPVVIRLLQGIVYHDTNEWRSLLMYQVAIRKYLGDIGLKLYLDENGGFAYVMQSSSEDDSVAEKLPRLTRKRKLSYGLTLLIVLLRERLDQHNAQGVEQGPLLLSRDDLHDMVRGFLRANPNEKKIAEQIDNYLGQLVQMQFLEENKRYGDRYVVRSILAAKVNIDLIDEIKTKLQQYRGRVNEDDE